MRAVIVLLLLPALALRIPSPVLPAAPVADVDGQAAAPGPEEVVRQLYDLVSFGAGQVPDWEQVADLFLEQATIVLRTGREETTVFDRAGFVADFQAFAASEVVSGSGFEERVLALRPLVFRDMAHVLVLYEARVPGLERPPQQGVDSFQLVRRDGAWRIVSVVNDVPDGQHPLPPDLLPR